MDLKLKIFSVCIALLLITTICSGIKVLHPGDVVKGKKLTETYYCLSEKENVIILNKLALLDLKDQIIALKDEQIKSLKDKENLLKLKVDSKTDFAEETKVFYMRSMDREKMLREEVRKQSRAKDRERKLRKGSMWLNLLLSGVIAATRR